MALPTKPQRKVEWEVHTIPISRSPTKTVNVYAIRYWAEDIPPRTIYVREEDFDARKIPSLIKADIEQREKVERGTITI
jgi:hypothetical protein